MLQINSSVYQIDKNLFEDTIGVDGFEMYIDINRYELLAIETQAKFVTAESLLIDLIQRVSNNRYHNASPSVIRELLTNVFSMESLIGKQMTGSKNNVSIDQEKVIKPLREVALNRLHSNPVYYGDIIEFCDLYLDYTKLRSFKNTLESKRKLILPPKNKVVDNFGNELYSITSMYEKQSTGRYYTNGDNLQGWNLDAVDTFTAPKGYCFVWADFDQIDLRVAANLVLFNGHPEMIEEFDKTEDKYEAVARIICNKLDKPFDLEKFKANRKAYKRAVLARLYGASMRTMMNAGFTDMTEISTLNSYYENHKYYQEYVKGFEQAIAFEAEVCIEDYFGEVRRIPIKVGSNNKPFKALEACLNTPIQSTSNDIVMLWVNELTKSFRILGMGKDKFRVALLRHDEAVFLVHEDCVPYLWLFKKYSSIFIDSWSELTIEPEFGFNYKVKNKELYDAYEKSIASNLNKLYDDVQPCKSANKNWKPCKNTIHLYHVAPVNPAEFTYYLLQGDVRWYESANVLADLINNKDKTATSYAIELIHEYQKSPDAYGSLLNFIDYYNKYYNTFITSTEPGVYKVIKRNELIKYLVDNNYGYVYVHNALVTDYVVLSNGIQMRFVKDEPLKDIIKRIESV